MRAQRRRWGRTLCVFTAVAVVVIAPSAMAADEPSSLEEAKAQGDAAASAAVHKHSGVYVYKGSQISAKERVSKGLACVDDIARSVCYDSAEAADDIVKAAVARKAAKRGRARTAQVQCPGGYALLWQFYYANWGGIAASLQRRHAWYNNGSDLNNETSSYKMGEHSGHLAENYNGGGWWLPYNTGVCGQHNNLNGTGWSDRVSSRYRN